VGSWEPTTARSRIRWSPAGLHQLVVAGLTLDPDVFWSKPILTFWLMSLSMAAFGLCTHRPEPSPCPAGLSGRCACPSASCRCWRWWRYMAVSASSVGARDFLSVLALGDFSHVQSGGQQAMTDMAFIGPMTMALAFVRSPCSTTKTESCRGGAGGDSPGHTTRPSISHRLLALTVLRRSWSIHPAAPLEHLAQRNLPIQAWWSLLPYAIGVWSV